MWMLALTEVLMKLRWVLLLETQEGVSFSVQFESKLLSILQYMLSCLQLILVWKWHEDLVFRRLTHLFQSGAV
ncbi:hypothetical protein DITRI_Ditri01bG0178100 [Diplodiscus trichospermus]